MREVQCDFEEGEKREKKQRAGNGAHDIDIIYRQ